MLVASHFIRELRIKFQLNESQCCTFEIFKEDTSKDASWPKTCKCSYLQATYGCSVNIYATEAFLPSNLNSSRRSRVCSSLSMKIRIEILKIYIYMGFF